MRKLYRKEVNTAFLVGAVVCGGIAGYGVNEMCGDGLKSFLKEWISDPIGVGSCSPSSKYVTREIVQCLDTKRDRPLHILEVGSGTGVCTREIINHLSGKKYTLDAIEINSVFAKELKKEFKDNFQVAIHEVDITKWKPTEQYDVIVSTLPFNLLPLEITAKVIESYKKWIVPGGRLSYVEGAGGSTLSKFFMNASARKSFDKQYKLVSEFKEAHLDKTVLILRNIPVYYVHHLKF